MNRFGQLRPVGGMVVSPSQIARQMRQQREFVSRVQPCRRCGALIRWMTRSDSERRLPIDVEPNPTGRWEWIPDTVAVRPVDHTSKPERRYDAHRCSPTPRSAA